MVDNASIIIQAVKFGYARYGARGAVAAAIAVGASYFVIKRVVPRYTGIDEKQVEKVYYQTTDDNKLTEILGEEFDQKFGDHPKKNSDDR